MYSITNIKGDIFSEVKSLINIEDVASKLNLNLSKEGNDLVGKCPTGHGSTSGTSFHIVTNTPEPYFHCFNCEAGGDAIKLVSISKKISNYAALLWLLDEFNLETHSNFSFSKKYIADIKSKATNTMLYESLMHWGQSLLLDDNSNDQNAKDVLDYLVNDRKYNKDKLKDTEFFYIPDTKQAKDYLFATFPEHREAILNLKIAGGGFLNEMKLNFPYRSTDGNIMGLVKRYHKPKGFVSGKKKDGTDIWARWDSTPGLKKNELFGLANVPQGEETILVVEGYPDAIYLRALGEKRITAVGSAILTEEHLSSIRKRGIKNIIISFDNDKPDKETGKITGVENTKKAVIMILKKSKITPYVIDPFVYSPQKDPDEYYKNHGYDELAKIFKEKPVHGITWLVDRVIKDVDSNSPFDKMVRKNEILELLASTKDESIIYHTLRTLKTKFDEPLDSLRKQLKGKYKDYIDDLEEHIKHDSIIPLNDMKSDSRGYYNVKEDEIHFGVDKEFIKEMMLDNGIEPPRIFPTFSVVFNPKDTGARFDLENRVLNRFTPTEYMKLSKNTDKINLDSSCKFTSALLENIIPVESERNHFLNWFSYVFSTREKVDTAWVFRGIPGAGKNLFFDHIISPLFGKKQTVVVDDDRLQSDFNGFMTNKLFVAFNEVANDETKARRSVKSKIKTLISEKAMLVNEKFIKAYETANDANVFFFTNEPLPMLIEMRDRRLIVVETGGKLERLKLFKEDPDKFITGLESELKSFAQFLLNYNYDKQAVREIINNNALASIKELSMNRFELFAHKLKTKDWDWFDSNYPRKGVHKSGYDYRSGLMTEKELNSGMVLKDTLLSTYNEIHEEHASKTKLSRQMKIYGVDTYRKKYDDSRDDEHFYIFN